MTTATLAKREVTECRCGRPFTEIRETTEEIYQLPRQVGALSSQTNAATIVCEGGHTFPLFGAYRAGAHGEVYEIGVPGITRTPATPVETPSGRCVGCGERIPGRSLYVVGPRGPEHFDCWRKHR